MIKMLRKRKQLDRTEKCFLNVLLNDAVLFDSFNALKPGKFSFRNTENRLPGDTASYHTKRGSLAIPL